MTEDSASKRPSVANCAQILGKLFFTVVLIGVCTFMALRYDFATATLAALPLAYVLRTAWDLPPDITHENKGVGGDKQGDYRIQYAVFGLGFFYLTYYTPIVGYVVERSAAAVFIVLPLIAERGAQLLGDVTDATVTFYERYGQPPAFPLLPVLDPLVLPLFV